MSKFFAASDSESESSSSEEEQMPQRPAAIASAFTFSDDEDETKRVVRSAKEKRYEELTEIIKLIRNHKKIKDMSKLLTGFENLAKAFIKAKPVIEKEEHGATPKFYVRCLVEMEDFVNECWEDRDGRKAMSKNNSKSLGTLRQKLRKYNRDFESAIEEFRQNPDEEEKDDEEEVSDSNVASDNEEDFMAAPAATVPKEPSSKFLVLDNEEALSDDSDDWGSSSDEELSSSSGDDDKYDGNLALKFLKKTSDKDGDADEERRKRRERRTLRSKKKDDEDEEGEWETVKSGAPRLMEKPKMFAKDAEINHPLVVKKLNEILAARGKKSTDRTEQISMLSELKTISDANDLGPAMALKIMFAIVASIFDYNPKVSSCMKADMWLKCLDNVEHLLRMLFKNNDIMIGEHIPEDSECLQAPPYRVRGCVLAIVERLDEEFIKMLQGCDAHSTEYVERLKDETRVCRIIKVLHDYLESPTSSAERRGLLSEICRIYLRRIEHIYYKFEDQTPFDEIFANFLIKIHSLPRVPRLGSYLYARRSVKFQKQSSFAALAAYAFQVGSERNAGDQHLSWQATRDRFDDQSSYFEVDSMRVPILSNRNKNRFPSYRTKMKKYQRLCFLLAAIVSALCFAIYYYKYQNLYHVMDVLGSMGSRPKKVNMSTLHGSNHEDEHRRMYQWFWMRMTENIQVYSAYNEAEHIKVFGTILLNEKLSNVQVKCLLWYAGLKKPDESTLTIVSLDDRKTVKNSTFESVMFKCNILRANGQVPYGITLIDASASDNTSHRILKVLPSSKLDSSIEEFTVCVLPPLNGPYDNVKEAIQHLEMHKLVGFNRFIFYDLSSSDRMQHLLREHAVNLGFAVEVLHWNFPHENALGSKSLLLAKNDCLYRSRAHSKYTLVSNISNCVVPKEDQSIFQIVNSTVASYAHLPVLVLAKGFFCDEFPDDGGKTYLPIKFKILVKTKRHPTLHVSRYRAELLYPVGSIDYVTSSNEIVSTSSIAKMVYLPIRETRVLVHVLRLCRGMKIGNSNIRQAKFVHDDNAIKYKDKLLRSALMAKIHYEF